VISQAPQHYWPGFQTGPFLCQRTRAGPFSTAQSGPSSGPYTIDPHSHSHVRCQSPQAHTGQLGCAASRLETVLAVRTFGDDLAAFGHDQLAGWGWT
jgi:hypothetical protein